MKTPKLKTRTRRLLAYIGLAAVMVLGFLDDQRDDKKFAEIIRNQEKETAARIADSCKSNNEGRAAIKGAFGDLITLATADSGKRDDESEAEYADRQLRVKLFVDQFNGQLKERLPQTECKPQPVKP